jgi:hypothetical protein
MRPLLPWLVGLVASLALLTGLALVNPGAAAADDVPVAPAPAAAPLAAQS